MTRPQGDRPANEAVRLQPWPGSRQGLWRGLTRGARRVITERGEATTRRLAPPLAWALVLGLPWLALTALPVRADSRTAESIWSQSDAQQRATSQIPLADRGGITQTRCQEVGVGRMGSLPRFRCTVWFTPVTPGAPVPSGAPQGTGAGGAGGRQP